MRQIRKVKDLTGFHLKAHDGEIGTLKEVYFDDRHWVVRYLVVRTGNWLFGREVLIAPEAVHKVDEDNRWLEVELTRKQVEEAPPIDSRLPVSRHYEQEYYRHYGWQPYWGTDSYLGVPPLVPPLLEGKNPDSPENPHLRSSREVMGYRIHALDGEIGYVEDFMLDEREWRVCYLSVDTRKWLPGKKILVSPAWIHEVSWASEGIVVDLPCDLIESAPEYDASKAVSRDYELALYKHYGKSLNRE